ncbi:MAG TPA: hypothetical protein VIM88_09385, partial [Sulfurovum sp.]|uniref:hypothetical protein n=1 Tax=Sulfurovum sp. TaxID=1969726 RepID=UPI002F93FA14
MKLSHIALSTLLTSSMTLTGCIDQGKDYPNQVYIYSGDPEDPGDDPGTGSDLERKTIPNDITSDTTLDANFVWIIDGLVTVHAGATLTIEPGTIIAGKAGTGDNTSYLVVDKDAQIRAIGTATSPITFTSEIAVDGGTGAAGQWGGVTLIGNAANSEVTAYEANTAFVPGYND